MWNRNDVAEHGAGGRDVICAWLIALAVLVILVLVSAYGPFGF